MRRRGSLARSLHSFRGPERISGSAHTFGYNGVFTAPKKTTRLVFYALLASLASVITDRIRRQGWEYRRTREVLERKRASSYMLSSTRVGPKASDA